MQRLRRAVGILAGAKAQGLSAHSDTGTQVFQRSRATVSGDVKSRQGLSDVRPRTAKLAQLQVANRAGVAYSQPLPL